MSDIFLKSMFHRHLHRYIVVPVKTLIDASLGPRRPIHVLVPEHVHLQDLAGPVQVFDEANAFGGRYELRFCGTAPEARSAQGLWLGRLGPLPTLDPGDWILVPGLDSTRLEHLAPVAVAWLRSAGTVGTRVASVCSGAFLLARAGLLDDRACTTHWKVIEELKRVVPRARVVDDRLFVLSIREVSEDRT
jgi:transcriptional regulator GlxA family with amidase domain